MRDPSDAAIGRAVRVIGVGPGDPSLLTQQAVAAVGALDVLLVIDKGDEVAELAELRHDVMRRHGRPGHRVVPVPDPVRDPQLPYPEAVKAWHQARARRVAAVLEHEVTDGEEVGILVWGDPSLYDSTLRVLDMVTALGRVTVESTVLPGVSSLHLLTARHRIPLNRVGRSVLITTGRELRDGWRPPGQDLVVFLDSANSYRSVLGQGYDIHWGAYLGSDDELLVAGPLDEVADQIAALRAAARARKGWIFDVYLLRHRD